MGNPDHTDKSGLARKKRTDSAVKQSSAEPCMSFSLTHVKGGGRGCLVWQCVLYPSTVVLWQTPADRVVPASSAEPEPCCLEAWQLQSAGPGSQAAPPETSHAAESDVGLSTLCMLHGDSLQRRHQVEARIALQPAGTINMHRPCRLSCACTDVGSASQPMPH